MNSYVRFKLALTEDQPTIKPYDEKLWAEMPEAAHRAHRDIARYGGRAASGAGRSC